MMMNSTVNSTLTEEVKHGEKLSFLSEDKSDNGMQAPVPEEKSKEIVEEKTKKVQQKSFSSKKVEKTESITSQPKMKSQKSKRKSRKSKKGQNRSKRPRLTKDEDEDLDFLNPPTEKTLWTRAVPLVATATVAATYIAFSFMKKSHS